MVALVAGNSLGLNLTSLATLGARGVAGNAALGRGTDRVIVNVANGNLVIQNQDDALAGPGMSEEAYWAQSARTVANQYADTYGGDVINAADRLRLSSAGTSEPLPEITDPRITRTRILADEYNALKVAQASANGDSLAPTVVNAARLGLYDTSIDGMPVKTTVDESTASILTSRFAGGVVHGAIDMVWQPIANTIDLGQVAVGLLSGGRYEPTWLSGIGQNYEAGMPYGETVTRAVLGSNPVTGVGLASYDLSSSALRGDWGGIAEGAGGLVGGFTAGKYGQRWMAPQVGAELGVIRMRTGSDIASPIPGLKDLPAGEARNFTGMPQPVLIGDGPLSRVFDTLDPQARYGAKSIGGYWSSAPYASESGWRSGAAVQKDWNAGTYQGSWTPDPQWAWGGTAAPQSIKNSFVRKWGLQFGWINKGGDPQIFVPNARSIIKPSDVVTQPAPWRKP